MPSSNCWQTYVFYTHCHYKSSFDFTTLLKIDKEIVPINPIVLMYAKFVSTSATKKRKKNLGNISYIVFVRSVKEYSNKIFFEFLSRTCSDCQPHRVCFSAVYFFIMSKRACLTILHFPTLCGSLIEECWYWWSCWKASPVELDVNHQRDGIMGSRIASKRVFWLFRLHCITLASKFQRCCFG